ncbi:MAG: hypothetical protein V3R37_07650 [Rhodospirillales bacterium]
MKYKTFYQAVLAIVFSTFVGVSAVSAEELKTLSADEIKKAFVGNTMDHEKVFVFWAPNGTIKGETKSGGHTDSGTYKIKSDNIYCRAWGTWRGGTEQCSVIKKAGDNYARVGLDGIVVSMFKILKGNPKGL